MLVFLGQGGAETQNDGTVLHASIQAAGIFKCLMMTGLPAILESPSLVRASVV
ncbi:hypothetical Protein YC6258_03514 [Gynuella sunshinyii YC6258]|uniref:Uncharacterized protein n=1 Tax=Gynuella sunshinyii YC6258 TaxID=1445510 RepID=A0A0C5V807_9GAMM|nr:hypothetical Protein YC6258_03514 [Gynuella sunshinyii YC6258]